MEPGLFFQKSQIFQISSSSHSKNAHIKLNGFQWVFGGWGNMPFMFFMGWMGQKSKNGPSRAVYPPGWGVMYFPWWATKKTLLISTLGGEIIECPCWAMALTLTLTLSDASELPAKAIKLLPVGSCCYQTGYNSPTLVDKQLGRVHFWTFGPSGP